MPANQDTVFEGVRGWAGAGPGGELVHCGGGLARLAPLGLGRLLGAALPRKRNYRLAVTWPNLPSPTSFSLHLRFVNFRLKDREARRGRRVSRPSWNQ